MTSDGVAEARVGDAARSAAGERQSRWRHAPLALFTIPMSLTGLGLAMRRASSSTLFPSALDATLRPVAEAILLAALASLAIVLAAHVMKLLRHPDATWADLTHPVRICFAAALPMALVLMAVAALPAYPQAAHAFWLTGTALYAAVALGAVALWQHRAPIDIALLNPAWFLPIVGHVLVAHAGVQLGYVETSWLVVGLSTPLWILVQTLLFYRNVFAAPLPPRLLPTLTIQIGPAPLIFLALIELQPGLDAVMRIIFYAGIGLMLVLWLPRLPQFLRLPFALSHWSFSFPLSAMAASMLAFADRAGSPAMWSAATLFLILPVLTTSYALIATLRAWRHGVFAKPEP